MINRIYSIVLFISNNELRGNVAPAEFNLALYNAIIEIYEEYFFELNRVLNRLNRGLVNNDFADLSNNYRDKIKFYLTQALVQPNDDADRYYQLPENLRYLDAVFHNNTEIEAMANSRQFKLVSSYEDVIVDDDNPVYLLENSNQLRVLPIDLVGALEVYYLRNPLQPKWTYTNVGGTEVFNPSARDFQDVDIHPSEEANIIRRVLMKMGINLKEQDLANYMINAENQKFQTENAS